MAFSFLGCRLLAGIGLGGQSRNGRDGLYAVDIFHPVLSGLEAIPGFKSLHSSGGTTCGYVDARAKIEY